MVVGSERDVVGELRTELNDRINAVAEEYGKTIARAANPASAALAEAGRGGDLGRGLERRLGRGADAAAAPRRGRGRGAPGVDAGRRRAR